VLVSSSSILGGGETCVVCGRTDCRTPATEHLASYPFIPGGGDPMAGKNFVIAPHRIVDHELERVMYGTGDRVPIADAVKYGLVPAADAPAVDVQPEQPRKRGRKAPAETRHHDAPSEDRTT
jgi:hypothetical protein